VTSASLSQVQDPPARLRPPRLSAWVGAISG